MARPAQATFLPPDITQIILRGGSNGPLGSFGAAALGFSLGGGYSLTLGLSYTERQGVEPLITLSLGKALRGGWNLSAAASRGDFGGDYRVDRLPEISLTRGGPIAHTILNYYLEAGAGYFVVHPNGLEGFRETLAATLSTSAIPLSPSIALSAGTWYRQYSYAGAGPGAAHNGWAGYAQLSIRPVEPLTTTFTYLRQTFAGSSPLLFDAIGEENALYGAASLRLGRSVSVQHSQKYAFLSRSITERTYGLSVTVDGRYTLGFGWDDIGQKLSASFSFSR